MSCVEAETVPIKTIKQYVDEEEENGNNKKKGTITKTTLITNNKKKLVNQSETEFIKSTVNRKLWRNKLVRIVWYNT